MLTLSRHRVVLLVVAGALALGLFGTAVAPTHAQAPQQASESSDTNVSVPAREIAVRPEIYPGTASFTDLAIPMDDGVILRGDVVRPADADGRPIRGRFPVIVTITAYNKTVIASPSGGLGGTSGDFFVKRGYVTLVVDARGTGSSGGVWNAFSPRENKDAGAIVEWAASRKREWSDGRIGMSGPSYMGISQLFAAASHPQGLKAIFPQVPGADVYRDVVASGGQIDVGFIPLWLGLVTGTGVIPPAYGATDPQSAFSMYADHLTGAATFTGPLVADATTGGDAAYDGKFYRDRSPIEVIDKVDVPTFFLGGEYDLFQRGTPLLFENLRKRGVPTKFMFGPWNHLDGSGGTGVADAGHGTLSQLQLMWFDRWVMGRKRTSELTRMAPLTYYEINSGHWLTAKNWIGRNQHADVFALSGSSSTGSGGGVLTKGATTDGTSDLLPIPIAGLCSRSTTQWTAGLPAQVGVDAACTDGQTNDSMGVVFDSSPLAKDLHFRGPLNARLYVSTPSGDGMLAVRVEAVSPDGTVEQITGGWQVISHRTLDRAKTRRMDGEILQAYHPFTKEAQRPLGSGQVAPVDVEIFPTGAVIPRGWQLRLSVQAFDTPHLLSPLTGIVGQLAPITIHVSAQYPSRLVLAKVGR